MAIPENIFLDAEATLTDLDTRLTTLEAGMDLTPIIDRLNALEAENAAIKTRLEAAEATITQHETRLDAVSAGAQG